MAARRRSRCSGRFKMSWDWRRYRSRRMWRTRSGWRCAIITRVEPCDSRLAPAWPAQWRRALASDQRALNEEVSMITKITGHVNRVLDEEIRLQVGPLEYQILVPEFIRRALQHKHAEEITL